MTDRSRARRRRGSSARLPRTQVPGEREAEIAQRRLSGDACEWYAPAALETYGYWRRAQVTVPFVYFVREDGDSPAIKIGWAAKPGERCAELQCGNPRKLHIAQLIVGGLETEQQLHRQFNSDWERGEWFNRPDAILRIAHRMASDQIAAHRRGDRSAFATITSPKT